MSYGSPPCREIDLVTLCVDIQPFDIWNFAASAAISCILAVKLL